MTKSLAQLENRQSDKNLKMILQKIRKVVLFYQIKRNFIIPSQYQMGGEAKIKRKKQSGLNDYFCCKYKLSIIILSFLEMIGPQDGKKNNTAPQGLQTMKIVDGKYLVKNKKLGQGSFAQTYLAIDNSTGQELACKMISKKNLIDKINSSKNKSMTKQYFISALKNEVNTWKAISHQNIVDFKDFSETSNNIYFFLEFCSQGNLESALLKKGYIKEQEAIPIIYQIAKGIEYLYEKGIFHRDIKTENILICQNNVVKISDFGFAKMIIDQEMKNSPKDGTSVGTPIYMSPQVLLAQPYTIKCDVWSCGIVFYKILYNLFPWEKTDHLNVLIERMKKQISFPPHIKVSDWLKNLIKHMLTVPQSQRISIKDVVNTIKQNCETIMSE